MLYNYEVKDRRVMEIPGTAPGTPNTAKNTGRTTELASVERLV